MHTLWLSNSTDSNLSRGITTDIEEIMYNDHHRSVIYNSVKLDSG